MKSALFSTHNVKSKGRNPGVPVLYSLTSRELRLSEEAVNTGRENP
jgi:hypothetical protein